MIDKKPISIEILYYICRTAYKVAFAFSLTESDLQEVERMQHEFHETETMISQMKRSEVASQFPIYRQIFVTLDNKFLQFRNGIRAELKKILPDLRGNRKNREDLKVLVGNYTTSVFQLKYIKPFLDARKKEIETIEVKISINLRLHT